MPRPETISIPSLDLLECPACRSGGLDPSTDRLGCAECGAAYEIRDGIGCFQSVFDRYSANYDRICEDDLAEPKTPDIVKETFADLIVSRAGGVICDLGCGDGYVIRRVRGDRRVAVDIAFPYLERLPESITRLWARVEEVPLKAGSVDTLICTDVLEHVLDANALVAEIDRLVAPSGAALLAFPFEQDLSVYELPEYKAKYGKYEFVHLRSIDYAMIARLFPGWEIAYERLITEGMPLMEFKPFPIKFLALRRSR